MKRIYILLFGLILLGACSKDSSVNTPSNGGNNGGSGKGGSLARFTIVNNYLYTVDESFLSVFDISNQSNPIFKNKIQIGFNVEAIFPFKNKLFIASNTSMYIYSLQNPESPNYEAQAQHLNGCDPVVANDSIAFLTIHGGNRCGSNINQLQVYNIKNMVYPQFITSIDMTNPFGLGLQDNTLFVCDNGTGMRVFDVTNQSNPTPISIITGEKFVDVIPMGNYMICMLTDGVAFFDITNRNNIKKLSVIKN